MLKHLHFKSLFLLLCLLVGNTSAWAEEITIWSEDFSGLDADATPTAPTNSSYTGVTYTCANGTGTSPGNTKVMNENLAGSSKPEIMIGKKGSGSDATGGTFTVVIPLNNIEGTLTLTYYQNNKSLKVSSTTSGVSGGQTLKPSDAGKQTTTFTGITKSMTSITIVFEATTTNNVRLDDIELKYTAEASVATPTFTVEEGTYISTQSVELECTTTGADIYYTLDGTTPTSSSTKYNNTAISISETKTIKAIAIKGSDASNVASATYTIYPVLHAGTSLDPYTVADARNAIEANTGMTGVYVTGIVYEGGSTLSSGAMNYWISDDGTETDKFEIYKGKGISGASFSSTDDVKVGDIVVVYGNIKKFGTTYEFDSGSQLISLDRPIVPVITVAETSLTGFTYGVGNGPSETKTFSVEGANLKADILLSLGEGNDYEISTTEGSGYANSLILTPTTGSVAETTIYARLKADLAIGAYNGTITLTSTDAITRTINLAGSVTAPTFSWDLSTDQTTTASETEMTWIGTYASMAIAKGKSSTNANNYYPGTDNRTSTRFYTGQNLTIAPASGYTITSIVFTATTDGYATALKNSKWTNATASASEKTVTITPSSGPVVISAAIGGTCGFTEVKVYYTTVDPVSATLNASGYATLASNKALDFSDDSEYSAWQITSVSGTAITFAKITGTVAEGTGILLKGTASASINIPVVASGTDISSTNKLVGITAATAIEADKYYGLSGNKFVKVNAGTVPAGKALLPASLISTAGARELTFIFEDEITGVSTVKTFFSNDKVMYNLKGQRINTPRKGEIYIMGGKKMVNK